jgi:hypothetical protein
MNLDPIELGRLAIMQSEPLRYVERRIEEADIIDNHHYAVAVTQQFTVPFWDDAEEKADPLDRDLLVPLGWFVKDRLPDIQVLDEDGSILPFLRRKDQGLIGATLLMDRWRPVFFAELSAETERNVQLMWTTVHASVERVVTSSAEGALITMYDLVSFLQEQSVNDEYSRAMRCFVLSILATDRFWLALKTLAKTRLLMAQMHGRPSHTYVVTIKYTERLPHRLSLSHDQRRRYARENLRYTSRRLVRHMLGWLGIGSIGIVRRAINLGQAASFWAIFSVPEGVEPIRCFWRTTMDKVLPQDVVSVERRKATAGRHHRHGQVVDPDVLSLDLQVEPSSAITGAAGLSALLYLIGVYVYKRMPQLIHEQHIYKTGSGYATSLIGIGTILAAVPATLAGALAYRGHTFVRWASRGPRAMLALLSAQAGLLAIVMSLHGPGAFASVLAFSLSVYSLGVTGIFLWIRFGTRWRKTERSRRPHRTKAASPLRCRKMQAKQAFIALVPWLLVVLLVARGQATLQAEHVFGSKFPENVLKAWSSWIRSL